MLENKLRYNVIIDIVEILRVRLCTRIVRSVTRKVV